MNFFDDIDELIKREMQRFHQMAKEMPLSENSMEPNIEEREGERTIRWGPFIYGRTTVVGPDGRMHTQEWGNLTPEAREKMKEQMNNPSFTFMFPPQPQDRRPSPIPDPMTPDRPFPGPQPQIQPKEKEYMIDMMDTEDGYTAIFDTPATSTDDIKTHVNGRHLQLWIQGRLFRELELPTPVELTSLHFKNGVVELQLRSKKPEEEPK
jgi:HSP20 family molecular chaperone IbpA